MSQGVSTDMSILTDWPSNSSFLAWWTNTLILADIDGKLSSSQKEHAVAEKTAEHTHKLKPQVKEQSCTVKEQLSRTPLNLRTTRKNFHWSGSVMIIGDFFSHFV